MDIHRNRKKIALKLDAIEKGFVYEIKLDSVFAKNQTDTLINKKLLIPLRKKNKNIGYTYNGEENNLYYSVLFVND